MQSITKEFPGVKALDNVNLEVERAEIHALIGENGAGKSTLMNVLSGTYPFGSYEGDIYYNGELCKFKTLKDSEAKGIVIIHQELALIPQLSIGENMFLGNEKATQLSGIDTNKVYFIAYANMGLLAGLCGLLCAARVGSVNGSTGTSFEMDAIGSCFIGGASAYGGSGTVGGVVIGALLLGIINMGMSILGIGDSWQYIVKGAVLLVAVIFDVVSSRKNGR